MVNKDSNLGAEIKANLHVMVLTEIKRFLIEAELSNDKVRLPNRPVGIRNNTINFN